MTSLRTFRCVLAMSILLRTLAFVARRPSNLNAIRTSQSRLLSTLSDEDEGFLLQAVEHAKNGLGQTWPNPAVGCVLVRQDTNEVIGSGFHPRAGYPHAEVFALLEAAGHVPDGVEAAKSVMNQNDGMERITELAQTYASAGGPAELFGDTLGDTPVTAYVTLEPCCHTGQTPPCATSLALAKADRVVVGFRDPNPRVDGGGVKLLQDAGVTVDLAEGETEQACAAIVADFCKRITPTAENDNWETEMTGAMRSSLRSLAGRKKADASLAEIPWGGRDKVAVDDNIEDAIQGLALDPSWMEHVDGVLWKNELVGLRLGKAIKKKKGVKLLGERIAQQLQAHVAQTVGHTCLLYRPGVPKVLDLEQVMKDSKQESKAEE